MTQAPNSRNTSEALFVWLRDWLADVGRNILSKHRRRYLRCLVEQHRALDVKGLKAGGAHAGVELGQVFVDLTVAPHPILTDNLAALPEQLQAGEHSIWKFLQFAPNAALRNFVILGPPGSGKTTLLKHMALTLATGRRRQREVDAPDKLPILLFLRDHAQLITDYPQLPLEQFAANSLARSGVRLPAVWFGQQLARGRCLVLLDGLDEVADPETRLQVADWINRQLAARPDVHFVITSQPFGYHHNPLSDVIVLELLPFDTGQVRRFVHNWYLADQTQAAQPSIASADAASLEAAEELLRRLRRTPALSALALNPLLLTMIATVQRSEGRLPEQRVELYGVLCLTLLRQVQPISGVDLGLTPEQLQHLLQILAYAMMCQQQREIALQEAHYLIYEPLREFGARVASTDFLEIVAYSSGLLLERELGVYSFAHLTFQEYLAAMHVKELGLEQDLLQHTHDGWWFETLRLYAALEDGTALIDACLADDPPTIPALMLAVECLVEAPRVDLRTRTRLESALAEDVDEADVERRRGLSEVLLARRLRQLAQFDEDRYVDNSLITQAEYQLFVDDQREHGLYCQPDHWSSYQHAPGEGKSPVVGVRASDAISFCEWLGQREAGQWFYRLPTTGEFDEDPSPRARLSAPKDVGYWVTAEHKYMCPIHGQTTPASTPEMLARFLSDDLARGLQANRGLARDLGIDREFDQTLELARQVSFETVSVTELGLDRAIDLGQALAQVKELGFELEVDLELAYMLIAARARTRALASALARGAGLVRDLALAGDSGSLSQAVARTRDLEQANSAVVALVRVFDNAAINLNVQTNDIDDIQSQVRGLAILLERTQELNAIIERLHRDEGRIDLAHNQDFARARELADVFGLGEDSALTRARDLLRVIEHKLDSVRTTQYDGDLNLERIRSLEPDWKHVSGMLRWYIRMRAAAWAAEAQQRQPAAPASSTPVNTRVSSDKLQGSIDEYLNLYIDLVFVEERRRGNIPPFESIRIVKARKKFNTPLARHPGHNSSSTS